MKRLLTLCILLLSLSLPSGGKGKEVKVLYWNIQNGMWHDQGNDYNDFVGYVKSLDPDICVWCEAESRYVTDTSAKLKMPEEQYLPWNWDILAARYGHPYTLIAGKNDSEEDAEKLAKLLRGMLCHVNLIRLNPVAETGLKSADKGRAPAFRDYLEAHGVPASIRRSLGQDIDAACGQLRKKMG